MVRSSPRLLGGLSHKEFLAKHWQRRPLLVRGALAPFRDPLTPDELAGLACEPGVESRLVRQRAGGRGPRWQLEWGPFEEALFASLPERRWTVLVQELNRWVPEAAALLDLVSFLPNVRVDDVMVSYAADGGGVGPHLDSYDVFLVQGMGKREWRWHERPTEDTTLRAGEQLRILETFVPDRVEVLEAGDVLYLPPGHGHFGEATGGPCMTYSLGFRSPSRAELWGAFARDLSRTADGEALLVDPKLAPQENGGAIPVALLAEVRRLVRSIDTSDDTIDRFYARFATRLKPGHELPRPRRPLDPADALARLASGAPLHRSEEGRFAFLPRPAGALSLFVAGDEIEVSRPASALAELICSARSIDGPRVAQAAKSAQAKALLGELLARGAVSVGRAPRASSPRRGS